MDGRRSGAMTCTAYCLEKTNISLVSSFLQKYLGSRISIPIYSSWYSRTRSFQQKNSILTFYFCLVIDLSSIFVTFVHNMNHFC